MTGKAQTLPSAQWGTVEWETYEHEGRRHEFTDRAIAIDQSGRRYRKSWWNHKVNWDVFWTADDKQPRSVRCDCGGEAFTLRYGSYEISATCLQCRREGVVYDG